MKSRSSLPWFQFSLRWLLLAMTVVAVVMAVWWIWLPWWRERVFVASLRERILAAQSSRDAGIAYQELMPPHQSQRLRRLMDDPDTSISLKACFELLRKRDREERMSKSDVAVFADHVRKRTGLKPPAWWLDGLPDRFPDRPHIITALSQDYPGGIYFKAEPTHIGRKFPVVCKVNGKQVWESSAWALGVNNLGGGTSGIWFHDAELVVGEERLVVWGNGTGGSYLEAFDRHTGANQFRFCSEFWYTER